MDTHALRELIACVNRVTETGDTGLTLADEMARPLSAVWQSWDDADTESSQVLGVFLFYRYLAAHDRTDMLMAIRTLMPCLLYEDMALPPDMLPFLADYGVCEAERLREDARSSPDPARAERAAFAWQRIVMATEDGHPQREERERALRRSLRLLAARRGDTAHLDQAVAAARAGLVPQGHRDRLATCHELLLALEERYEATGNAEDHEAALRCAEELAAYAHSSARDAIGCSLLFSFGEKLYQRFLRDPDTADLRRAIGFLQDSVEFPGPQLPTRLLVLSRALSLWSATARDPGIVTEAIARAEQAEELVQRNHQDYPLIKWQIASLYFARYHTTHSGDDLDRAAAAILEATLCLTRELQITALQSDIAFAQYERTEDSEHLFTVLALRKRVLRKLPEDDNFSRAEALYSLSQAQLHWYRRTGSLGDLDSAVDNGRAALDLVAATDTRRRQKFLCGLGRVHMTRFALRGERDALPEAIDRFREAVNDAPDRYLPVALLAAALGYRYDLTRDITDLDESIAAGERALELAPAQQRAGILLDLSGARRLRFGGTGDTTDLDRARAALAEARALPALSARYRMRISLEQAELASLSTVNPEERLSAFEAAVELLSEVGLSSPHHEDREFMLSVHAGLGAKAADAAVAANRPDRALELLERARGILADTMPTPGWRGTRATTARHLCRNATRGPIVTVSAIETGGLALLVTPSGVRPVALPGLRLHKARARHKALEMALASGACEDVLDVLTWLWHTVARPVLEALKAAGWQGARLWWCPVGVMSLFPLHAAGDGHDGVMDRVVSSYLPTVRSLPAERRRPASPGKALVVAMSRTPGQASLLGAASEVNSLSRLLPATVLHNEQATRDAVLTALPSTRIIHFACHAQADTREPTRSRLLLHDQPLTPRDLPFGLDADLAYLSACATSDVLFLGADEAMHITGAFHLAGFRHVIGTHWRIADLAAADIADHFYTVIAAHGPDHAAQALHTATAELRRAHPDRPDLWASHLHVGP
ncbi:CHAT domain-containing protein [Streptomyces sp. NEAU-174]|uniref:CHAT domain-containing protein n=1 Tax=Streptomyces sp. NEAU-174 TaxID=3458254 RepID=UPI004043FEFE